MANSRDIENLLTRLESSDGIDRQALSEIRRVKSSLADEGDGNDGRRRNLEFRARNAGKVRVNGQDVQPLTMMERAELSSSSSALPPNLDYKALQSLAALQESQARQAAAQQEMQTRADLNNRHSRFYDPASADGSPREIQISMGDVIDPAVEGVPPLADMRSIDGKLFLPPPPIRDVSNQPTVYNLNEAGRQAQAALAGKVAPPEISPEVMQSIIERGGNMNPQTGGFSVNAPPRPGNDPVQALGLRGLEAQYRQQLEDGMDVTPNDLVTSASQMVQGRRQAATPPAAGPEATIQEAMRRYPHHSREQIVAQLRLKGLI